MRRLRRLNRFYESNEPEFAYIRQTSKVGDIDFWKDEDDRVYKKCLDTLSQFVADYDWWDFVYERFEEDMDDKFGADVDLKKTYFDLGRGGYVKSEISLDDDAIIEILKQQRVKTPLLELIELGVVYCYDGVVDEKGFSYTLEGYEVDNKIFKKSSKILKKSGYYAKAIKNINNDGYDSGDEHYVTQEAIDLLIYDDESIIENAIEDWYKDVTEDLRISLENQYEDMMSEEYLVEYARANEYIFDEDGDLA